MFLLTPQMETHFLVICFLGDQAITISVLLTFKAFYLPKATELDLIGQSLFFLFFKCL